jgi:protein-S-isoprenylcysteine O-methyltransferase Ste14
VERLVRPKNLRLIIGGLVLVLFAVVFFLFGVQMIPRSNDPAAMMQTVGQVCGVVGTLGLLLAIAGLLGWQGLSKKP